MHSRLPWTLSLACILVLAPLCGVLLAALTGLLLEMLP
jgi:hypothetical protein